MASMKFFFNFVDKNFVVEIRFFLVKELRCKIQGLVIKALLVERCRYCWLVLLLLCCCFMSTISSYAYVMKIN